jgi:hypothetical protein
MHMPSRSWKDTLPHAVIGQLEDGRPLRRYSVEAIETLCSLRRSELGCLGPKSNDSARSLTARARLT